MNEIFVDINGLKLCVVVAGNPQHQPIIILHGWLDHAGSWSKVAEKLVADNYYVVIPDHRGHGKSEHAPQSSHYHFPDYVADLNQLIHHLNLQEIILIGHSMGGTIASLYAGLCASPQQLILIEGLGPQHESEVIATTRYLQHLKQRNATSEHTIIPSIQKAAQKLQRVHHYLSDEWSLELAKRLLKPCGKYHQWRWDPRHRHKSAIAFHLPRHLHILARISCPTSLVFGENSWYQKLPDLTTRIEAFSIPLHTYHLPCGHSPHLQCPEYLGQLLYQIIKG